MIKIGLISTFTINP